MTQRPPLATAGGGQFFSDKFDAFWSRPKSSDWLAFQEAPAAFVLLHASAALAVESVDRTERVAQEFARKGDVGHIADVGTLGVCNRRGAGFATMG